MIWFFVIDVSNSKNGPEEIIVKNTKVDVNTCTKKYFIVASLE